MRYRIHDFGEDNVLNPDRPGFQDLPLVHLFADNELEQLVTKVLGELGHDLDPEDIEWAVGTMRHFHD